MKTILITTDFSSNSKSAIRFALQMHSQALCKFVFYSVVETIAPTSWPKAEVDKFLKSELEKGRAQLKSFLEKAFKQLKVSNIDYQYEVQIGSAVSNMIIAYAKEIKADFICMGTRGAGAFQKIMGTHASTLVNSSPVPVIVVPKNYRLKDIDKVAYASDLENLEGEIPTALSFSGLFAVPLEVYHFNMLTPKQNETKEKGLNLQYRNQLCSFYCLQQKVQDTFIKNLQRVIKNKKPSMLIMFSKHKPNWIERLFFAGFTAGMSFDINIPLVSFRKES
ncbi:universal stress protein [Runella sp. MFBS21]|uniref:universal stress protein n=1 Tax=Runella sp. MFBS21 TaxID=3034018 RepID=UPI0023F9A39D|nr:universal stress protein [Runella sp. MFBS21]MDF7818639.1 universal stress protein [Runella sp. MFBS21]